MSFPADYRVRAEVIITDLENGNITDAIESVLRSNTKRTATILVLEVARQNPQKAQELLKHLQS